MELLILGGLLLLFVFAAMANRGEPEVETFVITRPVPQQGNPLAPMLLAIVILLLLTVLIDRVIGWLGA